MDIVVTIPKNEYVNDDRETAVFNQGGYEQFWQLARRPKQLKIGDRVFFIKHGRIESSMRVTQLFIFIKIVLHTLISISFTIVVDGR